MNLLRDATREEIGKLGFSGREDVFGVTTGDRSNGAVGARESFDSDCFGLEIARVLDAWGERADELSLVYWQLVDAADARGYRQVVRRLPVERREEVWALEANGFELMDVLVTFAYHFDGLVLPPDASSEITVAPATDADVESIVASIDPRVWASRYEADPTYTPDQITRMRRQWVTNSHNGRAAVMLVAKVSNQVAGYVVGLLYDDHGAIDLIETLPAYRRRGVASRLLAEAMAFFSTRTPALSVATQATNYSAAALYEEVGFRLEASHLTYRLNVASPAARHMPAANSKGLR